MGSSYINRFIQPDTIIPDPSNPQAWNRYAYVDNNPVNFNDPTGHKKWKWKGQKERNEEKELTGFQRERQNRLKRMEENIRQDRIAKDLGFESLLDFQQDGGYCDSNGCKWAFSWVPSKSQAGNITIKDFLMSLDNPSTMDKVSGGVGAVPGLLGKLIGEGAAAVLTIKQYLDGLANDDLNLKTDQASRYIDTTALQPDQTLVMTYTYTTTTISDPRSRSVITYNTGALTLGTFQDPTHIEIILQSTQAQNAADWFESILGR